MLSPQEAAAFARGQMFKRYVRAAAALNDIFDDSELAVRVARKRAAVGNWWKGAKPEHPMVAGYWLAAALWVGAILLGIIPAQGDAMNFYNHLGDPYAVHDYAAGAGLYYAPPVAMAMVLVGALGPQVFYAVMVGLGLGAVGWIGGKWAVLLLFFPPVWWDISAGNVNTVIGACIVAMLAKPGWIAVPLLTKVTPGVTALWWVVRGEWKPLLTGLGVTAGISLFTFAVLPEWWFGWVGGLLSNGTGYTGPGYFTVPVPMPPRVIVAAVLVVWAARKDRPRLLPIAGMLAVPVLWWSAIAIGVAAIREPLLRDLRAERERQNVRRWRRGEGAVRDLDAERA